MKGEARVLKEGVQVLAVQRCRQEAFEGVGGPQEIDMEAGAECAQEAEHAGVEVRGQRGAARADRGGPGGEDEHPQQHRALVRSPHRRDAVAQGQL